MKENFKSISIADLCLWFGISRQAYYIHKKRTRQDLLEQEILLNKVFELRSVHKFMGGRKLYYKLQEFMTEHGIKMGRDAFFDVLRDNRLLIKQRKRYHITTNSRHWMRKYANLIKSTEPMGPNHIWVSDITYWKTKGGHFYISFITDAYSRKIVGYNVGESLDALESVIALKMALKSLKPESTGLIHHSDRGVQYCSKEYI